MKILLINDIGVTFGGAEIQLFGLRDELRQRGHDVRLFTSNIRPSNMPLQADDMCQGSMSPLRLILQVANPSAIAQLRRILHQFQPDVVHVNIFLTQLSPLILPLLEHRPTVGYVMWYRMICPTGFKRLPDGSDCHVSPGLACWREGCIPAVAWGSYMAVLRLWPRWRHVFDRLVAVSAAVATLLRENGVETDAIVGAGIPARPPRLSPGSTPTAVFAGRLVREKGVDVLLRAFAQVVQQMPEARLIIAGTGPEQNTLAELVQALGLGQQVALTGHLARDELEKQFDQAWVQVVPSTWREPFGTVAAEAAMRGTATIVSDTGGLSDVVVEGETGFKLPPGDSDALAAALLKLLQDRALAERMGQAGAQRAHTYFSLATFTDHFLKLYEDVIAEYSVRETQSPDTPL